MVLQLHVWGPAFGLPSLDAECLAAIAYLAQTASSAGYELIQSSPSAVPTQHLPSLYDPSTATWTAGYVPITRYLRARPPSPAPPPATTTTTSQPTTTTTVPSPPPPQPTTPTRTTADATAYTTFLTAHAAPLLALYLYVSSANYAAATRPAYSAVLPLPLPWTEPPAVRAAMARRAAHLGLGGLDTDLGSESGLDGGGVGVESGSGLLAEQGEKGSLGSDGWVRVPSIYGLGRKKGVGESLSAEQRARIRLEAAAADVLDVLADVDWEEQGGQTAAVRCLAFGYLALMLLPEVPRPWLREVLERKYPALCAFVRTFKADVFPEGGSRALRLAEDKAGASTVAVTTRFARGVLFEVPLLGEWCGRWWAARKTRQALVRKGVETKGQSGGDVLLLVGSVLGLTAMGAGAFFYRGLPPFGEAVQVWRKPLVTLGSFGAAGAMFSGALYGVD